MSRVRLCHFYFFLHLSLLHTRLALASRSFTLPFCSGDGATDIVDLPMVGITGDLTSSLMVLIQDEVRLGLFILVRLPCFIFFFFWNFRRAFFSQNTTNGPCPHNKSQVLAHSPTFAMSKAISCGHHVDQLHRVSHADNEHHRRDPSRPR